MTELQYLIEKETFELLMCDAFIDSACYTGYILIMLSNNNFAFLSITWMISHNHWN